MKESINVDYETSSTKCECKIRMRFFFVIIIVALLEIIAVDVCNNTFELFEEEVLRFSSHFIVVSSSIFPLSISFAFFNHQWSCYRLVNQLGDTPAFMLNFNWS